MANDSRQLLQESGLSVTDINRGCTLDAGEKRQQAASPAQAEHTGQAGQPVCVKVIPKAARDLRPSSLQSGRLGPVSHASPPTDEGISRPGSAGDRAPGRSWLKANVDRWRQADPVDRISLCVCQAVQSSVLQEVSTVCPCHWN